MAIGLRHLIPTGTGHEEAAAAAFGTLLALLAVASFAAGQDLLAFAIAPLLVLAALRLDLPRAIACVVAVGPVCILATMQGQGPFARLAQPGPAAAAFLLSLLALVLVAGLTRRRWLAAWQSAGRAGEERLARTVHDLRTPIAGVVGFADLIRLDPLTPRQQGHLDRIGQSGEITLRLLNDLLDTAQLRAGTLRLECEPVAVHDEVRWVLALFEPQAARRGTVLDCTIDRFVPAMIESDGLRLRQVLLNLVGNAVKFTDAGRVSVTVSTNRGKLDDELVIAVADSGIGIAPEAQARMFDAYDQAGRAGPLARGGAGLGLAIVRELVALMEGRIAVTSRLGEGSCFTVTLPCHMLPGYAMKQSGEAAPAAQHPPSIARQRVSRR